MKKITFLSTLLCALLLSGCGIYIDTNRSDEVSKEPVSASVENKDVKTNKKTDKEIIDNYFKDKELLYKEMISDAFARYQPNIYVRIQDDDSEWCVGKEDGYCNDKEIKVYCSDCNCITYYETTAKLMVMLISEQIDSLIGRPGNINIEFIDDFNCKDYTGFGYGCGGTKTHAECY